MGGVRSVGGRLLAFLDAGALNAGGLGAGGFETGVFAIMNSDGRGWSSRAEWDGVSRRLRTVDVNTISSLVFLATAEERHPSV